MMWHTLNLVLWLVMVGALFVPTDHASAKWVALAGLVVAAFWEHAAIRGFLKHKKIDAAGRR